MTLENISIDGAPLAIDDNLALVVEVVGAKGQVYRVYHKSLPYDIVKPFVLTLTTAFSTIVRDYSGAMAVQYALPVLEKVAREDGTWDSMQLAFLDPIKSRAEVLVLKDGVWSVSALLAELRPDAIDAEALREYMNAAVFFTLVRRGSSRRWQEPFLNPLAMDISMVKCSLTAFTSLELQDFLQKLTVKETSKDPIVPSPTLGGAGSPLPQEGALPPTGVVT